MLVGTAALSILRKANAIQSHRIKFPSTVSIIRRARVLTYFLCFVFFAFSLFPSFSLRRSVKVPLFVDSLLSRYDCFILAK